MNYFIVLTPAFFLTIYMVIRLYELRRHDTLLFRICAIRRDAMAFLRLSGECLDQHHYAKTRELVDALDDTIHNFNRYKYTHFNLRHAVRDATRLKRMLSYFERQELREESIERLYERTAAAMLTAFFAYTPFLLFEVARIIASLMAQMGIRQCKIWAKQLADFDNWTKQQSDAYGLDRHGLSLS